MDVISHLESLGPYRSTTSIPFLWLVSGKCCSIAPKGIPPTDSTAAFQVGKNACCVLQDHSSEFLDR